MGLCSTIGQHLRAVCGTSASVVCCCKETRVVAQQVCDPDCPQEKGVLLFALLKLRGNAPHGHSPAESHRSLGSLRSSLKSCFL